MKTLFFLYVCKKIWAYYDEVYKITSIHRAMAALHIAHLSAVPLVGRLRGVAFRGG